MIFNGKLSRIGRQVVIDNLILNAVKYSYRCAIPVIEFGKVHAQAEDERYADKLFVAFQRLHDDTEFQGLGIGLATVRRIFHRYGGRIWAESKANAGAIFYFTLGAVKQSEVA